MCAWFALGATAVSAGTAIYSAKQNEKNANKAIDAQKQIASNLKYEPIDIEKLKAEATQNAIANATQSLAIERQLQPEVAATRDELARQVKSELKLGGNLSPDTRNEVTSAARVIGARSGIGSGSTTPLTAALLGISSTNLANSRRNAASTFLSNNELPAAGLDPGAVASLEVADNAANNQFNLEKSGAVSNIANSEAAARASQIGGQTGTVSSLANLLGTGIGAYTNSRSGIGPKTTYDEFAAKQPKPLYTPVDTTFTF